MLFRLTSSMQHALVIIYYVFSSDILNLREFSVLLCSLHGSYNH